MIEPGRCDHRALAAKFIYFCNKYGLEPIEALDMLEILFSAEDVDAERLIELKRWAIGVANGEQWAIDLCA